LPTFKLTLEYDGSRYHGWQIQPHVPTVQGVLETAIRQVAQQHVKVIGAGRTDAGVHALGQVAGFTTTASLSADEWLRALNGLLPEDIAALTVEPVPDTFHARFAAKSKLYRYRILARPHRAALDRHRVWHIWYALDVAAMRDAAACLIGNYDFSAFQGALSNTKDPMCDMTRLSVESSGDEVVIEITAARFLKQMVRTIVGTLVEVGRGKLERAAVAKILAARDRTKAGPTAPAHGLYLVRVEY
jgi:tRNA pseudouridine38-40 synthase